LKDELLERGFALGSSDLGPVQVAWVMNGRVHRGDTCSYPVPRSGFIQLRLLLRKRQTICPVKRFNASGSKLRSPPPEQLPTQLGSWDSLPPHDIPARFVGMSVHSVSGRVILEG
jgi:hypothetical protein